MAHNLHALLEAVLERSIPHLTNLAFVKETILYMKAQLESFTEAEEFLDKMILKEQDPTKRTDLKILQMFLTRSQQ